ncbi:uncharacterized protein LOC120117208 [Hibiscus syriacus]|uniref:uncharacterized protein LOC120117208 n=1 Tax=Hibiscus syriacus TaxID=106335 RepID=UPI001922F650|nr:uncharacterized protein LOC120117208 [Hibiscus syriacus]
MKRIIESIWGNSSQVKVSIAGPNLYVFSFLDAGLRDWVLDNGAWHVQNKPLVLRNWVPGMQKLSFDLSFMPIWIQLYNVPLELYSQKGLSYIASALGNPLFMDSVAASKNRLEFAKVCVEVEAGVVIPDIIHVIVSDGSSVSIKVHVPWMPKCYDKCKSFGHHVNSCYVDRQVPQKLKEVQVWRKKDVMMPVSKGDLPGVSTGIVGSVSSSKGMTDSFSGNLNNNAEEMVNGLQVGAAVETTVLVLQEATVPFLKEASVTSSQFPAADLLSTVPRTVIDPCEQDKGHATEGSLSQLQEVVHSVDFPSLQDSLRKRTKGRKKEAVGSSSKMETVVEGPRKARVASMGVAMLLNEIKSKKKDHLEKSRCTMGVPGTGNSAQSFPA